MGNKKNQKIKKAIPCPSIKVETDEPDRSTTPPARMSRRERQPKKIFSPTYDPRRQIKDEPISPPDSRPASPFRTFNSQNIDGVPKNSRSPSSSSHKETPINRQTARNTKQADVEIRPMNIFEPDDPRRPRGRPKKLQLDESILSSSSSLPEVVAPEKVTGKDVQVKIEMVRDSPEIFTPSLAERVKRHSAAKANANMQKAVEEPRRKESRPLLPKRRASASSFSPKFIEKTKTDLGKKTKYLQTSAANEEANVDKSVGSEIDEKGEAAETTPRAISSAKRTVCVNSLDDKGGTPKTAMATPSTNTEQANVDKPEIKKDDPAVSSLTKPSTLVYKQELYKRLLHPDPGPHRKIAKPVILPVTASNTKLDSPKSITPTSKTSTPLTSVSKTSTPQATTPITSVKASEKAKFYHDATASKPILPVTKKISSTALTAAATTRTMVASSTSNKEPLNTFKKTDCTKEAITLPKAEIKKKYEIGHLAPEIPKKQIDTTQKCITELPFKEAATPRPYILPRKTAVFKASEERLARSSAMISRLVNREGNKIEAVGDLLFEGSSSKRLPPFPYVLPKTSDYQKKVEPKTEPAEKEEEAHPRLKFTISLKGTPSMVKKADTPEIRTVEKEDSQPKIKEEPLSDDDTTRKSTLRPAPIRKPPTSQLRITSSLRNRDSRILSTEKFKPKPKPIPLKFSKESSLDGSSSQNSISPELGGTGLGFTYRNAKKNTDDNNGEPLFINTDDLDDDLPSMRSRLRPRKVTSKASNDSSSNSKPETPTPTPIPSHRLNTRSQRKCIPKPRRPAPPKQKWFDGKVEDLPEQYLSALPYELDKKKYQSVARIAVRSVLITGQPPAPRVYEKPQTLVNKWVRPARNDEKEDYNPEDFKAVMAEIPTLLPKVLAEFEDDRDVLMWPTPPENFELYEEEVSKYLKKCVKLDLDIDKALRFLHANCGHCVKQARRCVTGALEELKSDEPPPFTEEEEDFFTCLFMGYGKDFIEFDGDFPDHTTFDLVHHYYKNKPFYGYKKLLQNTTVKDSEMEDFKRTDDDITHFYSGKCHICKRTDKYLASIDDWFVCKTCRYYRDACCDFSGKIENYEVAFLPHHFEAIEDPYQKGPWERFYGLESIDQELWLPSTIKPTRTEIKEYIKEEKERMLKLGIEPAMNDITESHYNMLKPFFREDKRSDNETTRKLMKKKNIAKKRIATSISFLDLIERFEKIELKPIQIPKKLRIPKDKMTSDFSEKDRYFTAQCFLRYGLDFETAAEVVKSKTPEAIEGYYNNNKLYFDNILEKHRDQKK